MMHKSSSPALLRSQRNLPVVLDVDTGRDDAWTIIGAVRKRDLLAIVTSYGNSPLADTTRNSINVLALAWKSVQPPPARTTQVWAGESMPSAPPTPQALHEIFRRWNINGNGICNIDIPKSLDRSLGGKMGWEADFADFLRRYGPVNYIACGPMTNLARLAEHMGKDVHHYIPQVIAMGGSISPDLPVDFNFKADPRAAQKVIETFGNDLTLVPFDQSQKLRMTDQDIAQLKPKDEAGAFSKTLMVEHARGWSPDNSIMLHDPSTLLALQPNFGTRKETVSVVQSGEMAGKLIRDRNGTTLKTIQLRGCHAKKAKYTLLQRYLKLGLS